MASEADVTGLLRAWSSGDEAAGEALLPVIYAELKKISRAQIHLAGVPVTLQATELVHEAYIRLAGQRQADWNDRSHFFALAATVIRRLLLDHARGRCAQRRDRRREVALDSVPELMSTSAAEELIQLDNALINLTRMDERQGRLVELRYFAGLSIQEAAEVLSISPATAKRDWRLARAWLYRQLDNQSAR